MSDNDQDWVSRTQKKKNVEALQDLGVQLTKLADSTLKKIGLPEDLLDALLEHKKINSNGALKRQVQSIGQYRLVDMKRQGGIFYVGIFQ